MRVLLTKTDPKRTSKYPPSLTRPAAPSPRFAPPQGLEGIRNSCRDDSCPLPPLRGKGWGWGGSSKRGSAILLLLTLLPTPTWSAENPPAQIEVLTRSPRDFGFTLGDVLSQQIRITLPAGTQLNANALPTPGRLNSWLELRTVEHTTPTDNPQVHELTLTYQLFKHVKQAQSLTLPSSTLLLESGEPLALPTWPITYAPLLVENEALTVRPASLPALRDTTPLRQRLWWIMGGLSLCLLGWLWATHRLPFLPKQPNAFTRAVRHLRQLNTQAQTPDAKGWEVFQQALTRSAGQSVFPDQLDDYFNAHPHYQPLAAQTQTLLDQAHQARFAPDDATHTATYPALADILQLCQQFSQREQALWKQ